MLFKELQGVSIPAHSYLYRFGSVDKLVYCSEDVGASPYVPTSEQANAALTEYQAWCSEFNQQQNADLIRLLTDVEASKTVLLSEVDKQTAKFEDNLNKDMYFTSSLGFKVNGDRRTKDNLQDLVTFFDLQAVEGKIQYRDYDNHDQSLTKEQLQTLLTEHVVNGQSLYTKKWQLQSEIKAAQDFDSLSQIKIEFPMNDFSKEAEVESGIMI